MNMSDVTVGIKTFKREEKLFNLLNSLDRWNFKEVIVADDSEISEEKWGRYQEMKTRMPLKVLDLPYDVGVGTKYQEIVSKLNSGFLLIMDDDQIPYKISSMKEILLHNKNLGGVAGTWVQDNEIKCGAHNFRVKNGYLLRDIKNISKNISKNPYFIFDFIPQSGIFREECVKESGWDDYYKIGKEHIDFFFSHYKKTDWEFAVTPTSLFGHFPGGSQEYISNRRSKEKLQESKEYFLDKWGLKGILEYELDFARDPNFRKSIEISLKRNIPFVGVRFLQALKDQARKFKYV